MTDNTRGGSESGTAPLVATDEVTYSGDTANVQLVKVVQTTGSEGSKTVVDPAHDDVDAGNPVKIGGKASTATPSDVSTDGDRVDAWFSRKGALVVDGGVVHDSVDTGNALKIGGKANDAPPTAVADGDRVNGWFARNGQLGVFIVAADGSKIETAFGDADAVTTNQRGMANNNRLYSFNGTSWDRIRGDITNGLDVDVTRLPASTNTIEIVGDVGHDVAASGNPVLNSGISQDTDDTAPPNRVSAEGDSTRIATDRDGTQYVRPHGPQIWSYHENSSSALTDTSVHTAPGAGLSLYVTDIVVSTGAATALNVFFEEGATTVLGPYYLEAIAGRGFALHFVTPKKITANTALTVTTSTGIAHSIDVTGYTAQG